MSDQPEQPDQQDAEDQQEDPPDGRGPRPIDPNELAAWIVRQTTGEDHSDDSA